jgi:hypothetical protein
MEYLFNFDGTFEIHDDIEVLKRMGLALGLDKGECTDDEILQAKSVLPKALEMYIDQIGKRNDDWRAEFGDLEYEESYFQDGDAVEENVENVCYEVADNSALGLTTLTVPTGDLSGITMSVEDLEMQAAIESLQNQATQQLGSPGNEQDVGEESYGEEEEGVSE